MFKIDQECELYNPSADSSNAEMTLYGFWAYSSHIHSKVTWLLVFLHIMLEASMCMYLQCALEVDLQAEFIEQPENMS